MSVTITIVVGALPSTAAWPAIAGAAATAASALGFALATHEEDAEVGEGLEVDISLENSDTVTGELQVGEELVFTRGGMRIRFYRDVEGNSGIRVHGHGSEAKLREIGEEFSKKIVQQYSYHQLVTELKSRDYNVTDEQVEEDGTVRLHVRAFRGT